MTAFLWTVIIVMSLSVIGQAHCIVKREEKRDLRFTPFDLIIGCILIGWAVRLLP